MKKIITLNNLPIKKEAIVKLAKFLSAHTKKPCTIGITGETASGKSTITEDIISSINDFSKRINIKDPITRLNTDDYYYDRSEMVIAAGGFDNFVKNYYQGKDYLNNKTTGQGE